MRRRRSMIPGSTHPPQQQQADEVVPMVLTWIVFSLDQLRVRQIGSRCGCVPVVSCRVK